MRFLRKSILARLVSYFLALSAIGVTVTTLTTLAIVRNALTRSIYDRLEAVAALKEDELNRWVNDQHEELVHLSTESILIANARALADAKEGSPEYKNARAKMLELFAEEIESHPSFREISLLSAVGGKVLVSTNVESEGQYRVSDTYYTQGRLDYYVQNVYTSPQTGQPAMTLSAPVRDAGGKLLGVTAIHINLDRLDSIILQRAGLGETGETYLVDRHSNFISAARFGEREFPRGVHTQGIDEALRGADGFGQYLNYEDIPVLGAYHWVNEREMALLSEISQREAFAPVQRVAAAILASGFAIAALLAFGVFLLARQVARPLLAIHATADLMAAGSLDVVAPVLTEDEVGALAASFNTMSGQIRQLVSGLEQRVNERTAELERTSAQNEKRARELQTISEISRAISSEQGLEQLLPLITRLVSDRFGFYHVGIFLLDEDANRAVLRAANSPGGQRMLEKGHRLEIGQVGIVGKVAATATPRIALNVGEDAAYFNNPDLPETRSEIALPMSAGGKIIGVLDVQSDQPNAFTSEDVNILSILADQVAIAIENARLLETARKSLAETEAVYRQYIKREWTSFIGEGRLTGFYYRPGGAVSLESPVDLGEAGETARAGKSYQRDSHDPSGAAALAVPVRLRGETIAVIHLSVPAGKRWTDDEIDIVEAVAERVALSIENARLFQAASNRAARERIVSDISSRIGGNIRVRNILQVAAQELSQALNGSEVLIQLQSPKHPAEVEE